MGYGPSFKIFKSPIMWNIGVPLQLTGTEQSLPPSAHFVIISELVTALSNAIIIFWPVTFVKTYVM